MMIDELDSLENANAAIKRSHGREQLISLISSYEPDYKFVRFSKKGNIEFLNKSLQSVIVNSSTGRITDRPGKSNLAKFEIDVERVKQFYIQEDLKYIRTDNGKAMFTDKDGRPWAFSTAKKGIIDIDKPIPPIGKTSIYAIQKAEIEKAFHEVCNMKNGFVIKSSNFSDFSFLVLHRNAIGQSLSTHVTIDVNKFFPKFDPKRPVAEKITYARPELLGKINQHIKTEITKAKTKEIPIADPFKVKDASSVFYEYKENYIKKAADMSLDELLFGKMIFKYGQTKVVSTLDNPNIIRVYDEDISIMLSEKMKFIPGSLKSNGVNYERITKGVKECAKYARHILECEKSLQFELASASGILLGNAVVEVTAVKKNRFRFEHKLKKQFVVPSVFDEDFNVDTWKSVFALKIEQILQNIKAQFDQEENRCIHLYKIFQSPLTVDIVRIIMENEKYITATAVTEILHGTHVKLNTTIKYPDNIHLYKIFTAEEIKNRISMLIDKDILTTVTIKGTYGNFDILNILKMNRKSLPSNFVDLLGCSTPDLKISDIEKKLSDAEELSIQEKEFYMEYTHDCTEPRVYMNLIAFLEDKEYMCIHGAALSDKFLSAPPEIDEYLLMYKMTLNRSDYRAKWVVSLKKSKK